MQGLKTSLHHSSMLCNQAQTRHGVAKPLLKADSPSQILARAARHRTPSTVSSRAEARRRPSAIADAAAGATGPSTSQGAAEASTSQPADYFATDKRPIILFDGVCNLCNSGVNFMLDWDTQGEYRLAALQSTPGRQLLNRCGRAPDDISSIVLVEESNHYIKSDAILRIASRLAVPFPLVAAALLPMPHFVRDTFYDQIANNRYSFFGKTNTCRLSADGFQDRFLGA